MATHAQSACRHRPTVFRRLRGTRPSERRCASFGINSTSDARSAALPRCLRYTRRTPIFRSLVKALEHVSRRRALASCVLPPLPDHFGRRHCSPLSPFRSQCTRSSTVLLQRLFRVLDSQFLLYWELYEFICRRRRRRRRRRRSRWARRRELNRALPETATNVTETARTRATATSARRVMTTPAIVLKMREKLQVTVDPIEVSMGTWRQR